MKALAISIALVATACGLGPGRGVRLYDGAEQSRSAVATLHGPVLSVDGHEISSRTRSFELLPGCHVVTSGGSVGHGTDHDAWIAYLPTVTFAFRMLPGATYNIAFSIDPTLGRGPVGSGQVTATERDAAGKLRTVSPVKNASEVRDCRRWSPPH